MVVLDVFIGLVFVYFLYSLFVSILAELFSTWIGMRSRILRQGIDNFLNDQHPRKHGLFMWLHDLFLVEHSNFRYTTAGKFYNEPTIKYLAKVGENKRYSIKYTKPAYIEKNHFVSAIVSMLIRRSIGVTEWDKVKFAIENNALNLEKDTLQMFKDWLVQSNDSYEKFKAYIGNSYEEVNDRLVGWYKRKIGVLLFFLGLVLSFIMNVDTFDIVKTLANNPDMRMALVEKAINATKTESMLADTTLSYAYHSTKGSIDEVSNILGSGWQTQFKGSEGFVTKAKVIWNASNPLTQKFWGFMITAFALSMGAKFWFDLLKRLVSLRGNGEKPEEHDINKVQTEDNALIPDKGLKLTTSDPAKIALSVHRKEWETQPGFIAANLKYSNNNVGYIELIFEDDRDIASMPAFVLNPIDPKLPHISLTYIHGEKGSFDNEIAPTVLDGALLQTTTKSWGTPAGIVYDPRSDNNVILTCGHVVRNDKSAFIDQTKSKIEYKDPKTGNLLKLGSTRNIVLSSFCDAGIVEVDRTTTLKMNGLQTLNNVRDVTSVEEHKTRVNIHTLRKDPQSPSDPLIVKGKIIFTGQNFSFQDRPSADFRFYDLFLIGDPNNNFSNPLTFPGDSGSLISDETGSQIGILVGAVVINNQHFSYGIKLKDIFEILQLEPAKNEKKYTYFMESSPPSMPSA
ncbi:MAG: hypothetical protein AAGA77_12770 [Bacteroidota bacterium]